VAELDSDQVEALRRLRAVFGFVEVLEVVDHEADQDEDDDKAVED
jgi:adenylyl- and sulfurtransferase ThiI